MRRFFGESGIFADWVTTTLCPATVSVVVRGEAVPLLVAAMVTGPLPLPLLPLVMLSQEDDSDDVQAQPLVVVTEMLALPPAAAIDICVGETAKLHESASCVTVTECPATVSVALRALVVVFSEAA